MVGLRKIIWLLIITTTFVVLLDLYSNLESDYDSARYVRINYDEFVDITNEDSYLRTGFMHFFYGDSLVSGFPYLSSMIKNLMVVAILFPLIRNSEVLLSPLWWAFIALPGKEAFIVLSIALFHSVVAREYFKNFARLVLGVILCFLVRPQYLILFFIAFVFINNGFTKTTRRKVGFMLLLISFVVSSVFWEYTLSGNYSSGGVDVESSLAVINEFRNLTMGYDVVNITIRSIVYFLYLVALPILEFARIIIEWSNSEIGIQPYNLYQFGAIIELTRQYWVSGNSEKSMRLIVVCVLIADAFSFIHTRYLLPLLLFNLYYKKKQ